VGVHNVIYLNTVGYYYDGYTPNLVVEYVLINCT